MRTLLKICFGLLTWLLFYRVFILRSQIQDIQRKLNFPEFQGTAHLKSLQFSFESLRRRCVRVRVLILLLGISLLGWFFWSGSG